LQARQSGLALPLREHATVRFAEDGVASQVTVMPQGGKHVVPQRDLAHLAVLRCRDLASRQVARNDETTCDQIDVVTRERQQLTLT